MKFSEYRNEFMRWPKNCWIRSTVARTNYYNKGGFQCYATYHAVRTRMGRFVYVCTLTRYQRYNIHCRTLELGTAIDWCDEKLEVERQKRDDRIRKRKKL